MKFTLSKDEVQALLAKALNIPADTVSVTIKDLTVDVTQGIQDLVFVVPPTKAEIAAAAEDAAALAAAEEAKAIEAEAIEAAESKTTKSNKKSKKSEEPEPEPEPDFDDDADDEADDDDDGLDFL